MNNFSKLASIDVSKMIDKKQNLSYISWPHAVNALMEHDPAANWSFHGPISFGETMMVVCTVTAFGKPITMHLPVMDHRNQAIKNPDAVAVNKAMMRCLVKGIACHGLGLSVYAGEDLPSFPDPETGEVPAPAPKAEAPRPKPPAKVEGKAGEFQLSIAAEPEASEEEWFKVVMEATQMLLDTVKTEAQVLSVFNKNKVIFDRVKAIPGEAYNELLAAFKAAKARVNTKEEA